MHGFEHCGIRADVAGWSKAKPTNQSSHEIRQDVSEHVLHNKHIKSVRIQDKMHRSRINDTVFPLDVREILSNLASCFQE